MGEVHLANDTRLNRKVAIKLLHAGAVERGVSQQRFESEARAISSLNHPHICTLHDVSEQDGRAYLVMELLEGETIARRLTRGGLSPDLVLRHAIEIAEALDHAHRRGIVHRDLKPANVMLTRAGAKLLDFGVAKLQATPSNDEPSPTVTSEQPLTRDGHMVGTLQYMAPEQLDGRVVDARTDLFAFGTLVHEMSTGRRAFDASSQLALAAAIRGDHPPPISTLQPLSSPALDRVVQKCLAKDPDDRWQTARDLADALKWISQDSSSESTRRLAPAAPASSRRRPLAIAAALLLLASAGAAGLWLWRQPGAGLQATNLRLVSTFSGEHWGAAFSPDGRFIAFLKEADGIPQVWVKSLAEGEPIQITFGETPVRRLTWSPLNDQIVFSRFRAGLWTVPPLGGAARRVLEFGDSPKFSASGSRMVFTRGMAIWTADADGSNAREVSGLPTTPWSAVDRAPALSPDGGTIAFFHPQNTPLHGDIWVIPAAGGEPRQITFDTTESGWPRWTPDGRSIVYSSTRGGSLTLWRVAATGGTPMALTTGAGEDTEVDIAADGRTLLYGTQRKSWSLVLLDPATGQAKEVLSRRTRLLFPSLSPSGDRIAFMQPSDGACISMWCRLTGATFGKSRRSKAKTMSSRTGRVTGPHSISTSSSPRNHFAGSQSTAGRAWRSRPSTSSMKGLPRWIRQAAPWRTKSRRAASISQRPPLFAILQPARRSLSAARSPAHTGRRIRELSSDGSCLPIRVATSGIDGTWLLALRMDNPAGRWSEASNRFHLETA